MVRERLSIKVAELRVIYKLVQKNFPCVLSCWNTLRCPVLGSFNPNPNSRLKHSKARFCWAILPLLSLSRELRLSLWPHNYRSALNTSYQRKFDWLLTRIFRMFKCSNWQREMIFAHNGNEILTCRQRAFSLQSKGASVTRSLIASIIFFRRAALPSFASNIFLLLICKRHK